MTLSDKFLSDAIARDKSSDAEDQVHTINARIMIEQEAKRANENGDVDAYERCIEARSAFRAAKLEAPYLVSWTAGTSRRPSSCLGGR